MFIRKVKVVKFIIRPTIYRLPYLLFVLKDLKYAL